VISKGNIKIKERKKYLQPKLIAENMNMLNALICNIQNIISISFKILMDIWYSLV